MKGPIEVFLCPEEIDGEGGASGSQLTVDDSPSKSSTTTTTCSEESSDGFNGESHPSVKYSQLDLCYTVMLTSNYHRYSHLLISSPHHSPQSQERREGRR